MWCARLIFSARGTRSVEAEADFGAVLGVRQIYGFGPTRSHPVARDSQNSSHRPLSWQHRSAMMALAPVTVQRIPDCLSRSPMIVLQPASTTPEPTNRH